MPNPKPTQNHFDKSQAFEFAKRAGWLSLLVAIVAVTVWIRLPRENAGLLSLFSAVACLGIPVAFSELRLWFSKQNRLN